MVVKFGEQLIFYHQKLKKADLTIENLFENFLCDKLQIKFLKFISKMNKKSTNIAMLSEFGRYPLCIKDITNTCNVLQRLLTTNSALLQDALKKVVKSQVVRK